MTPKPAKAVFDLDGTLSNPIDGISRSLNHALRLHGFETVPKSRVAEFIGPALDQTFHILTGTSDVETTTTLVRTYRERYSTIGFSENTLYPGVPEALRVLQEAGVVMGVCTSKRTDYATRILEMFKIRGFFEFIDGGEIGIEKWEQLERLREQGMVDEGSLMIGDRAVDLRAAHRNGLPAAGVLWGFGSRSELEADDPVFLFESPEEWAVLTRVDEGKRPNG